MYTANCKSCHADNGSGFVGPNLTDDHYKNVKKLTDIARVVEDGAGQRQHAGLAEPAASERDRPGFGLRGQLARPEPARPAEPEGEVIPPWPAAPCRRGVRGREDAAK